MKGGGLHGGWLREVAVAGWLCGSLGGAARSRSWRAEGQEFGAIDSIRSSGAICSRGKSTPVAVVRIQGRTGVLSYLAQPKRIDDKRHLV